MVLNSGENRVDEARVVNPFINLQTIPDPQELIDKAFRRAGKAVVKTRAHLRGKPRAFVVKKVEEQKIRVAHQVLSDNLKKVLRQAPRLESLHPFHYELVDLLVGVDKYKKALGAIAWAVKALRTVELETTRETRRTRTLEEVYSAKKAAYGRYSAIIRRIGGELSFLSSKRGLLRQLPNIRVDIPSVVIAGYPNVGKTSLLSQLTGSNPAIAPYPFTTKGIQIGYLAVGSREYQIIDTPGLLDRPLSKRNPIERQAICALVHIANLVLFMFDPSTTCGYPISSQKTLYSQIRELLGSATIIPIANKIDLVGEEALTPIKELDPIPVSASTGEGVSKVREYICAYTKNIPKRLEPG
ncbi:MAG: hypothetical protein DRO11_08490 [Methanobacteriota archaeon]|nr:MAG: hypothetical protein DRO11_08490 [Euryarchaeota archaeon]